MPKKISIIQKREWFNSFEKGVSEAKIAQKSHHDLKTIKSGIEEVSRERDSQLARAELLRDALRKHQDQMLACIDNIVNTLELPEVNLSTVLPIRLKDAEVIYTEKNGLELHLYSENRPEWDLLKEHLGKRDQLWKYLEKWKSAVISHVHVRRQLYSELERLLKDEDYRLVDNSGTAPFLYRDTVWQLYRDLLKSTLEEKTKTNFPQLIKTHAETGEVYYGSRVVLAKIPGNEEKCRDDILHILDELEKSPFLDTLKETYGEIKKNIPILNKAAVEFTLMGLIPGRCRVCRRLGI